MLISLKLYLLKAARPDSISIFVYDFIRWMVLVAYIKHRDDCSFPSQLPYISSKICLQNKLYIKEQCGNLPLFKIQSRHRSEYDCITIQTFAINKGKTIMSKNEYT